MMRLCDFEKPTRKRWLRVPKNKPGWRYKTLPSESYRTNLHNLVAVWCFDNGWSYEVTQGERVYIRIPMEFWLRVRKSFSAVRVANREADLAKLSAIMLQIILEKGHA